MSEAIITFEGGSVQVEFSGVWTKKMVDVASKSMVLKLPAHLATLRASEPKSKKEKTK